MNLRPSPRDEILLRRLLEDSNESATAALFVRLYRQCSELRHWLRKDYAQSKKLREDFDTFTRRRRPPAVTRFAELTDDNGPWLEERRRLKKQIPGRIYGGLTWSEVMRLVHQYQAGGLDLGVFLLVREWRRTGKASPALMWAGLAFLEAVFPSGRRRLLKHLNEALSFVKELEDKAKRRSMIGYADWWKLHVLSYMLRNPAECYRTRELRAHLATLGLESSNKEIQRFCTRHGIKRDVCAGRPRTRKARQALGWHCSEQQDERASGSRAGHRG